jgi:hypothetical protein
MDFVRSNERTPDSKAGSVLTRDKTRPKDRLCSDNSVVLKKPARSAIDAGIVFSDKLL